MSVRELETALRSSWTRETFAAYADVLQTAGDLRGEWIALELAMLRDGVTPAVQQRRDKLLAPHKLGTFSHSQFSYGFIDDLIIHPKLLSNRKRVAELGVAMLGGPLGGYVRRLALAGSPAELATYVETLAAAPRPWLYELVLDPGDKIRAPVIPNDAMRRLLDRCPELTSIGLVRASAIEMFGNLARPGLVVAPSRRRRGVGVVRFTIAHHGYEDIELSRLERLHGGSVDEMSDPTREAWAELRWRIHLATHDDRACAVAPFPIHLLVRIVREIDTTSYYGEDWAALDRKLERTTEVSVEF